MPPGTRPAPEHRELPVLLGTAVPLEEGQVLHCGSPDPTCQPIITPTPGPPLKMLRVNGICRSGEDEGCSEKSAPSAALLLEEPPSSTLPVHLKTQPEDPRTQPKGGREGETGQVGGGGWDEKEIRRE